MVVILVTLTMVTSGRSADLPRSTVTDVARADGDQERHSSNCHVRIHDTTGHVNEPTWTYVITHGMGGLREQDRFMRLAEQIKQRKPDCEVLIVDWSHDASAKAFGFPSPWQVARRVPSVADRVASILKSWGVRPERTTLIGESFGNCVNARVSEAMGGHSRMLVFNPAQDAAGYVLPSLSGCASQSWSFHTYSPFDSQREVADADFFLETPPSANATEQHIYGIDWLANQLASDNLAWLDFGCQVPERKPASFRGIAARSGELIDVVAKRTPTAIMPEG